MGSITSNEFSKFLHFEGGKGSALKMKPYLIAATVISLILLQITAVVWSLSCPEYKEDNCRCTSDEPDLINECSKNDETISLDLKLSNELSIFKIECKNVRQIFNLLKVKEIGLIPSVSSEITINSCSSSVVRSILKSIIDQTNSTSLTFNVNNLPVLSHDTFSFRVELTTLNIHGNKLKGLPKDIFQSQTSLKEVNLSGNGLIALHPNIFDNISLVKLDLTDNKLIELHLNIVTKESLQHIRFDDNLLACDCDVLKQLDQNKDKFGSQKICGGFSFDEKLSLLDCITTLLNVRSPRRTTYRPSKKRPTKHCTTSRPIDSTTHIKSTTTSLPPTTTSTSTSTTVRPSTTTSKPKSTTVLPPSTTSKPMPPSDHTVTACIIVIVILIIIIICIVISLIVHFRRNHHRYEHLN